MSSRPRIVFLGNHTVGVRALRVLQRDADLVGVVAHPDDPEDGVRYESVYDEAVRRGLPVLRGTGRSAVVMEFVRKCAPDLLWVTDYRYLLPSLLVNLARLGAVNLHPSLLPRYRGRASINWAILRGETELGLSAHLIDDGMDTGDIMAQRRYTLAQHEDVGDALEKLYPLYEAITAEVVAAFLSGSLPRRAQEVAHASVFPRRTPEDGLIDWTAPSRDVWNLIRAVAAPYPGAFSSAGSTRLTIWRAAAVESFARDTSPEAGEILDVSPDRKSLTVACGDAALVVTRYSLAAQTGDTAIHPGDVLGDTRACVAHVTL